jgi:hypothetical protein
MTDFKFEFYQTRQNLISPQTSEIFHSNILKLSHLVAQLESASVRSSTDNRIVTKGHTFLYSINPGNDIIENLDIHFEECKFLDYVHCNRFVSMAFANCSIEKLTMPDDTTQLAVMGGSVHELTSSWDKQGTHCLFDNVTIENSYFKSRLQEVFFKMCTFTREISFKIESNRDKTMQNLYFTNCMFKCAPDFMGCNFSKSVSFYNCKFTVASEATGKYYRDLKHKMSDNHDELSASFFGGMEMKTKHGDLTFGIEYCLSHGYSWLSDHGLDQFRPVRLLSWLAGAALLTWGLVLAWSGEFAKSETSGEHLSSAMQIIYLTFVSILGPLRLLGGFNLLKIDTFASQLLMWAFTTVASLLWFFVIMAVRRRFKVG